MGEDTEEFTIGDIGEIMGEGRGGRYGGIRRGGTGRRQDGKDGYGSLDGGKETRLGRKRWEGWDGTGLKAPMAMPGIDEIFSKIFPANVLVGREHSAEGMGWRR